MNGKIVSTQRLIEELTKVPIVYFGQSDEIDFDLLEYNLEKVFNDD